MPSLERLRTHLMLLLAAALVTVVARKALAGRYALERRELNNQSWQQRARSLAATWGSHPFTPASAGLPQQALERLPWPAHSLTPVQAARLRQRFPEVLAYLQEPRLEDYLRLKTNALRWDFTANARVTREFAAALEGADEPVALITRLWQATAAPTNHLVRGQVTAVCLENLGFSLSRTNSRAALLDGAMSKGLTMLRVAPEPGFHYAGRPVTEEGGGPDELYAHFSLYARSSTSTNAGPLYFTLAWSEPDQQWVPARLMADVVLRLEVLF